jgi:hypothetical protein
MCVTDSWDAHKSFMHLIFVLKNGCDMPPASWGRDERQFKRGMMKIDARGEVVQETTSPRSRELPTHPWKMGLSGEI